MIWSTLEIQSPFERLNMSNSKLAALREKFSKQAAQQGGGSQYFPFFTAPYDTTTQIRFLQDKNPNNPLDFLQLKKSHTFMINGKKTVVPCLTMYEDENGVPHKCPACDLARDFYKSNDKDHGKLFYASKSYIAQALIETTPVTKTDGGTYEGEIRLLELSTSIYNIIKGAFDSGDDLEYIPYVQLDNNDDPTYSFRIKRVELAGYANYTNSRFSARPTVVEDELWNKMVSQAIDLSTVLAKNPGVKRMEDAIEAVLSGRPMDESEEAPAPTPKAKPAAAVKKPSFDDEEDDEPVVVKKKPAPVVEEDEDDEPAPAPVAKKKPVVEDDDVDDDAMRLLAQISERRAAAGK